MSAAVDRLAEALGRARAAHERRPGDARAELAYERARADFLQAQLTETESDLKRERGRRAGFEARVGEIRREFAARIAAAIGRGRPERRRRARGPQPVPLFERVG